MTAREELLRRADGLAWVSDTELGLGEPLVALTLGARGVPRVLRGSAVLIWEATEQPGTTAEIAARVVALIAQADGAPVTQEVLTQVHADVAAFLDELTAAGYLLADHSTAELMAQPTQD